MEFKLEGIFSLESKIIIITGASGLLGRKHAEAIASYGGTPVLIDLSEKIVSEQADELNDKYGVNSSGYCADVAKEEDVVLSSKKIIDKYGRIDGLVNNAANNPKMEDSTDKNFSRLEHFSLDAWNQDVAVGLTGAFLCSKHYGYQISQNSEGGSIINISSDLGLIAPDQRLYSKPGLPDDLQPVKPVSTV